MMPAATVSAGQPREGQLISVLVPMYNEEEGASQSLNLILEALEGMGFPFELIVVDDGSTDGTLAAAARAMAGREHCAAVSHPHNMGLGAALRTGLARSRGDVLVVMDSDLSYSTACIRRLVEGLGDRDVVACSPYLRGTRVDGVGILRVLPSKAVNVVYGILFGGARGGNERISCYTSMARAYRTESLRSITWTRHGFDSQAEIMVRLALGGFDIDEIPATLGRRSSGRSKFRALREVFPHLRLMVELLGLAPGRGKALEGDQEPAR